MHYRKKMIICDYSLVEGSDILFLLKFMLLAYNVSQVLKCLKDLWMQRILKENLSIQLALSLPKNIV